MLKAVHTWSLFRTLGRPVTEGEVPTLGMTPHAGDGLDLLELPAALASHGFQSAQLVHFFLPRRDASYLAELRSAFESAGVDLECYLIDDGDLTNTDDWHERFVSDRIDDAIALGAPKARVVAGRAQPTAETQALSAERLCRLADAHPEIRLITENFKEMVPDADSVLSLLDRTEGKVGLLADLGNWPAPQKFADLPRVVHLAESCQAKCGTNPDGTLLLDDYRHVLQVMVDGGYTGPYAMVHDGPDDREWDRLDDLFAVVEEVADASVRTQAG